MLLQYNKYFLFTLFIITFPCVSLIAPTEKTSHDTITSNVQRPKPIPYWFIQAYQAVVKIQRAASLLLEPYLSREEYAIAISTVTRTEESAFFANTKKSICLESLLGKLKQMGNDPMISKKFLDWFITQLQVSPDRANLVQAYRMLKIITIPSSFDWETVSLEPSEIPLLLRGISADATVLINTNDCCPICQDYTNQAAQEEDPEATVVKTHCNHVFHKTCLQRLLIRNIYDATCPLCRKSLSPIVD